MKVAVIGDSCTDEFIYVHAERLAPDLPIPVVVEKQRVYNPGMAANVARAIEFHGVTTELFSQPGWQDTTKTRVVDERTNHTFIRLDKPFSGHSFELSDVDLNGFDAVVISDYAKGFVTPKVIQAITKEHALVFLDTKRPLGKWAESASYIKINQHEWKASQSRMTRTLRSKTICTLGGQGASYKNQHFPVEEVEVRDTSGAGDVFLARLVVEVLRNCSIEESIRMANESASEVVRVRGVGIA